MQGPSLIDSFPIAVKVGKRLPLGHEMLDKASSERYNANMLIV